jgi:hypothetical protein
LPCSSKNHGNQFQSVFEKYESIQDESIKSTPLEGELSVDFSIDFDLKSENSNNLSSYSFRDWQVENEMIDPIENIIIDYNNLNLETDVMIKDSGVFNFPKKIDLDTPQFLGKGKGSMENNFITTKIVPEMTLKKPEKEDATLVLEECNDDLIQLIDGPSKPAGKGAFGRVFIPISDVSNVVIKEMEVGLQRESLIRKEILISLMFPDSDNIVNYYKACYIDRKIDDQEKRFYYIFMEKCSSDFGDWFFDKVEEKDILMVEKIIRQISEGYAEMHKKNVLHIDNHIGNYMICNNKIKIIDFGIAVFLPKLRPMQKMIQENLEYNELYNFFKTLISYKKIQDKRIIDIIDKLRRVGHGRRGIQSMEEFIIKLEDIFMNTQHLLATGNYHELENQEIFKVISLMYLLVFFWINY